MAERSHKTIILGMLEEHTVCRYSVGPRNDFLVITTKRLEWNILQYLSWNYGRDPWDKVWSHELLASCKRTPSFVFCDKLLSHKIWDKIHDSYMKSVDRKSYPNWTLRKISPISYDLGIRLLIELYQSTPIILELCAYK
jgi:hypothetical protein